MKLMDPDCWLVIGTDNRPRGQFKAYYCVAASEARMKEEDLRSKGLTVRAGTVRAMLGK